MKVEESLNVKFDESPPPTKLSPLVDDDVGEEEAIENNTKVVNNSNKEDESIGVDENPNKTNGRWDIFQSIQVHQGDVKEVRVGRLQTHQDADVNGDQAYQGRQSQLRG
ncbi:hypothetical protein Tco_1224049 [Tanacetum coccineum]